MKLGIEWNFEFNGTVAEQADYIKKYGFDATFIGLGGVDMDEVMGELDRVGVTCENCHAPYNRINELWKSGEAGDEVVDELCGYIDTCASFGIKTLVVHLSSGMKPPRMSDVGFDRIHRLMEHADSKGVTIAYENIRRLDNVAYALENYPKAGLCWDVGHEACYTADKQFMLIFGNRIAALHLHDNNAVYDDDSHQFPYDGKIDMDRAARHLARSGYEGSIMLEVRMQNVKLTDPHEFYSKAHAAASRFAKAVEHYKSEK